jgi:thioredoxin-related protein
MNNTQNYIIYGEIYMFKKIVLISILCLFFTSIILSQTDKSASSKGTKSDTIKLISPKPAKEILKSAIDEAKESGKSVFVIFTASWCKWCHILEKVMDSTNLKKIFDDNFVIVHIDIRERGEKIKTLENPGGKELLQKFGGEKAGIPFYVFIDDKGIKLADSKVMPKDANIGYPGSAKEIEAFAKLLKKASKKITNEEIKTIADYLTTNAPK